MARVRARERPRGDPRGNVAAALPRGRSLRRAARCLGGRGSPRRATLSVDLRLLQLPRVVDVDRLPLAENVERGLPRLAMAVAGVLRAAEGEMHLGSDRARVHVRDAGDEIAHRTERLVHVASEDRRRQPVADAVRDADRPVEVLDADEGRRRAEDLLLRDSHLRVDVPEERRPIVEAVPEAVARRDLTAGQQLRTLVDAHLCVRVDLLERALVDHGADVGAVFPAGAEPQAFGCRREPRRELVVDALLRDYARSGRAALTGGAERGPDDPL